ncbi:permease-like cell division protein FtsX [Nonomuraea sp. NPDC050790]|uniref:permease-like cell division protein FtsX n=1 Tax=Nonomuraea sp. NPDC050790 TaxID=3364371 RepID=UPI003794CBAB
MMVFLCMDDDAHERCRGRAVTAEQKRTIAAALKRLPEASMVRFVDQDEALRQFREDYRHNEALRSAARRADMPESFEVEIRVLKQEYAARVEKLPGVSMVAMLRTGFWPGKAHARVRLCPPRNDVGGCEGRGQATDRERDAVFEAFRTLQSVRRIYLEPREHAIRDWGNAYTSTTVEQKIVTPAIGESFHLVLADPVDLAPVVSALKGLPGVDEVVRH